MTPGPSVSPETPDASTVRLIPLDYASAELGHS